MGLEDFIASFGGEPQVAGDHPHDVAQHDEPQQKPEIAQNVPMEDPPSEVKRLVLKRDAGQHTQPEQPQQQRQMQGRDATQTVLNHLVSQIHDPDDSVVQDPPSNAEVPHINDAMVNDMPHNDTHVTDADDAITEAEISDEERHMAEMRRVAELFKNSDTPQHQKSKWWSIYQESQTKRIAGMPDYQQRAIQNGRFMISDDGALLILPDYQTHGKSTSDMLHERWGVN